MPPVYIDSPRTEIGDASRLSNLTDPDFSIEPSFHSPGKRQSGVVATQTATRNATRTSALRTPTIRAALNDRRNPPAKPEFTPLLKSATTNRKIQRAVVLKPNGDDGALQTPAALKPGYNFDTPKLPEPSIIYDNSSASLLDGDITPVAPAVSSSIMSTPLPELQSQTGAAALDGGGNILTLRDQEAKLEQIGKENFGLKLKIHFLEENLKKSGNDYNQETIKENTELKVDRVTITRDFKIQRKALVEAEQQLTQYREQLRQYMNSVKERHADEALQEEMDELRRIADERLQEMQQLRDELKNANSGGEEEINRLQDDIGDMEAELREKDRIIDSREDEIEELQKKVQSGENNMDEEREERIHELEQELEQLSQEKDEEIQNLQEDLQNLQSEKEDIVGSVSKEKDDKISNLEKKLAQVQRERADEVEALEDRVRLAESSGSNKLQLAQQAAQDAREEASRTKREKDDEIDSLQTQIGNIDALREQLEASRKELREYQEDAKLKAERFRSQEDTVRQLQSINSGLERNLQSTRAKMEEQESNLDATKQLREKLRQKDQELSPLRHTAEDRRLARQEINTLRNEIHEMEVEMRSLREKARECNAAKEEAKQLRSTVEQRESELALIQKSTEKPNAQVEALQAVVSDRGSELEKLRKSMNEQLSKIEDLQHAAESRDRELKAVRREIANSKELHEEEIEVLETSLDEAKEEHAKLEKEIQHLKRTKSNSTDFQRKTESLESDLRVTKQVKVEIEQDLKSLQVKLLRSETAKEEQQEKIARLTRDLQEAHAKTFNEHTMAKERRELHDLLRETKLEAEDLEAQLTNKNELLEAAKMELKEMVRSRDRKARTSTKRDSAKQQQQQQQSNNTIEVMTLKDEIMDRDKRHRGELRGLAKQIQYLHARCAREEGFRGSLAYSKRFFLMQIDMYNACNKADLRLLEEMGLTPDASIREKKPSLRTVGWAIIATKRMQKMRTDWLSTRQVHESLLRKLDQVRGGC